MTPVEKIPQDWLTELLARTDIGEVIGQCIKLARAGSEYRACCPFHSERTPSFTVNVQKRFFHCFGCGKHGNVIDFLVQHKRLGFREAVIALARRAGMQLPLPPKAQQDRRREREIVSACRQFHRFFRHQLKPRRALLRTLGIDEALAGRFCLGYAPTSYTMPLEPTAALSEAGLATESGGPTITDRLVIPINTNRGDLIGLVATEPHSRLAQTPIVCGLPSAYEHIIEAPPPVGRYSRDILIAPSPMELLLLTAAGLSATAIPTHYPASVHFIRLSRLTDSIVLCLPSGDTGEMLATLAAHEYANVFSRDIATVRVLYFPPDQPLSGLIRNRGADAFRAKLEEAEPLLDSALRVLPRRLNNQNPHDRQRYVSHLLRFAEASSKAVAMVAAHALAHSWGIPATEVSRALQRSGLDLQNNDQYDAPPALRLLAALLHAPSCVRYVADIPQSEDPHVRLLQELIVHLRTVPAPSKHEVSDFIAHHPQRTLLMQLIAQRQPSSVEPVVAFVESMHALESQSSSALPIRSNPAESLAARANLTM